MPLTSHKTSQPFLFAIRTKLLRKVQVILI